MKKDIGDILVKIWIVGAFILIIVLFIWWLFGDSPTFEQFIFGWLFILTGWVFNIEKRIINLDLKSKYSFRNLEDKINNRFDKIENLVKKK